MNKETYFYNAITRMTTIARLRLSLLSILVVMSGNGLAQPLDPVSACPQHTQTVIEGRFCNHRVDELNYVAFPLNNSLPSATFSQGNSLNFATKINDHRHIVGRAFTNTGTLHSVKVEINPLDYASHTFVDLGLSSFASEALGINNNNLIVGTGQHSSSPSDDTPLLWNCGMKGGKTILNSPWLGEATAASFSASGDDLIVGYARDPNLQRTVGFVTTTSRINQGLPQTTLGNFENWPSDVNDSQVVVGAGIDGGFSRAFTCENESNCYFLDNISFFSEAHAINNNLQPMVVGSRLSPNSWRFEAMLWSTEGETELPRLNNTGGASANDVADGGDIVGASGGRAVLWRDGDVHDLNSLTSNISGVTLTRAISINRHGDILAIGNNTPFLLVPMENISQ